MMLRPATAAVKESAQRVPRRPRSLRFILAYTRVLTLDDSTERKVDVDGRGARVETESAAHPPSLLLSCPPSCLL